MAAGLLPDEGIAAELEYILSAPISGVLPWTLVLFINDFTPDVDTVLADLTLATWSGYNPITLDRDLWTTPVVDAGCASSSWGTVPIVWNVGVVTPLINYGAAYVDYSTGVLRWVQRFDDEDLNPISTGGKFTLLPEFTLTSAECSMSLMAARKRAAKHRRRTRSG